MKLHTLVVVQIISILFAVGGVIPLIAQTNTATATATNSAPSTNAPSATTPLGGTVTFNSQTTSEVTTLSYELTSHAAKRIANAVDDALSQKANEAVADNSPSAAVTPAVSDPKQAADLIVTPANSQPDASDSSNPPNKKYKAVIIVNQKRSALLTIQYEAMISQLSYIVDHSNQIQQQFDIASQIGSEVPLDGSDPRVMSLAQRVHKTFSDRGYKDFADKVINIPTPPPKSAVLASYAVTAIKKSWESPAGPEILNAISSIQDYHASTNKPQSPEATEITSKAADQISAGKIPEGIQTWLSGAPVVAQDQLYTAASANTTPQTPSIKALQYAIPYIGQVQAAVDALNGLGQSVATFVSLFRQTEATNGVSVTIPTEALNALVIGHLKRSGTGIRCFSADYLPDEVDTIPEGSGLEQSKILENIHNLSAIADQLAYDTSRIDTKNNQILPSFDGPGVPLDMSQEKNQILVLNALLNFASLLPDLSKDKTAAPQTAIDTKFGNTLQSLSSELTQYQTTVSKLLASLYGSTYTPTTPASDDSSKQGQTQGQTQNPSALAPLASFITMSINPVVTITSGSSPVATNSATASTNSATASTNAPSTAGSQTPAGSSPSSTSPLAAILQQEALYSKLTRYPMLYLNVLSAAGANMTSNGWFTSDFYYNAGVAVDFFLVDTDGEVLASSAEDNQSPYVHAVDHSDGERLPTVVTTLSDVTTRSDIDDLNHEEPETRFTTTDVKRTPAVCASKQNSKGH